MKVELPYRSFIEVNVGYHTEVLAYNLAENRTHYLTNTGISMRSRRYYSFSGQALV
jgi:hypothetical protein